MIYFFMNSYGRNLKSGGPVVSVSRLTGVLAKQNIEYRIITSGTDIESLRCEDEFEENVVRFNEKSIAYFIFLIRLRAEIGRDDIVFTQSFFSPFFSIIPLFFLFNKGKTFIAPRGELYDGALETGSMKKKIWMFFFNILFGNRVSLVATSTQERGAINDKLARSNVKELPNLPSPPSYQLVSEKKPSGSIHLIFLSRLVEKKNLDFLLRVLSDVQRSVVLNIYGDFESEGYAKKCRKLARGLGDQIEINFNGFLNPDTREDVLSEHDLFVFPTKGENYGHVIAEALSVGLPCVISPYTPWGGWLKVGVNEIPLEASDWREFIECFSSASRQAIFDNYRNYYLKQIDEFDLAFLS